MLNAFERILRNLHGVDNIIIKDDRLMFWAKLKLGTYICKCTANSLISVTSSSIRDNDLQLYIAVKR